MKGLQSSLRRMLSVVLLVGILLSGCSVPGFSEKTDELSVSGFAFNTIYTLTVYEGGSQTLLDNCVSLCTEYEEFFSRTREGSELYRINYLQELYAQMQDKGGKTNIAELESELKEAWNTKGDIPFFSLNKKGAMTVEISEEMANIVEKGLEYGKLSGGKFDITIGAVSRLWDFTAEKPSVPKQAAVKEAVSRVDYRKLKLQQRRLTFQGAGILLDLGGIAKGFIADELKNYLIQNGVQSGMINLGGNILCIGGKPDGQAFRIGIQQPFADRNETIAAVQAEDNSIVSSGIYERYFVAEDGTLYHHILNPDTGYPYENNLLGVTILSGESADGDGLSTTAFALGLEKGLDLINSLDGVEAVFITSDEQLHYSKGFAEKLVNE